MLNFFVNMLNVSVDMLNVSVDILNDMLYDMLNVLQHFSLPCSTAESLNNKSLYLSHFSTD